MKSNPDFERMIFPVQFKYLDRGAAGGEGVVEGYANVFGNLDHNGDIVRPGAFKKTIQERVSKGLVPFLDSHQWDASHTIGTVTEAHEDAKGLRFRARMSQAPSALEIRQKMIEGHIRRLSIGFAPVRESYERADEIAGDPLGADSPRRKSIVRHLHEVKLFEVSAVPIAANEAATIVSVKAAVPFQDLPLAERDREWDAGRARARLAEWAGGDEDPSKINWARYRRAFLWYDRQHADDLSAYKLPIADLIEGELAAVPRAIFAAAGAIQGARASGDHARLDLGGDEEGVRENIERYYQKMARQFDDPSIVAPWRRKSLDSIVLAARLAGRYDLEEIAASAFELLSIVKPDHRAPLLRRLGARPLPPAEPAFALSTLKQRSSRLGLELIRSRVSDR